MPAARKTVLGMDRNVFFTGLTSFCTDTATKMIYAVLPMFLLSIGATKTELSLIEGVAESTASLLKAFSGWWSDKIGRNKPFMLIGYVMTAVLSPLFAAATSPMQVLLIRFSERVGKGIRTAPRDSLIAASSQADQKGRSFGFHKAMDNSGAIIGPLLAFVVLRLCWGDYRRVFLLAALPGLLGVSVLALGVREAKGGAARPAGRRARDFPLRYYAFLAIVFVFTLGNSTDALLLVKANDVGIEAAFIPLVYLVFNAVAVLCAVPAGALSDRIGRERLIVCGYSLYALIYLGFAATSGKAAVIALFALYGLYSAATDGVQKALVADLIAADQRGTGLGLYHALLGTTLLPASLIAGALYDRVGNRAPFFFGAAMAFIAAILMLGFYRGAAKQAWKEGNV